MDKTMSYSVAGVADDLAMLRIGNQPTHRLGIAEPKTGIHFSARCLIRLGPRGVPRDPVWSWSR
jgi:hypothetical protein